MHTMSIRVSKTQKSNSVVSTKQLTIREKVFRKLFGIPHRIMVIIPGDCVEEICIDGRGGEQI